MGADRLGRAPALEVAPPDATQDVASCDGANFKESL